MIPPRPRPRRERGFALLIVLWTLPLLTLIGSQLAASGRFETRLVANLRSAARAEAIADGAVREAVFHLVDASWAADGRPHVVRIGDGTAELRIVDEAGRIDPNTSDAALMQAVFRQVGVAAGRAAALVDAMQQWRMESSDAPVIAARYHAAGLPYAPTFKPFRSVDEIGLVLGMTPDVLAALAPHLSVFRQLPPDPRLADPLVVAALRGSGTAPDLSRLGDSRAGTLIADIAVVAAVPGGGRFSRHAVVQIAAIDRSNPRPWRILTWDAAAD